MTSEERKEYQKQWRANNPDKVKAWPSNKITEEKKAYQKQWRKRNPDKVSAAAKRWREKDLAEARRRGREQQKKRRENPEEREKDRVRGLNYYYAKGKNNFCRTTEGRFKAKLRQKYGLSLERYELLLANTKGKCPICGDPISRQTAHIDHCHATNIVRGLLCPMCNQAEGFLRTPAIALKMYEYMSRNEIFYPNGTVSL